MKPVIDSINAQPTRTYARSADDRAADFRRGWEIGLEAIAIDTAPIHAYRIRNGLQENGREPHWDLLTVEEKARASRFRVRSARDAFVSARGNLRALLGMHLRMDPVRLRFSLSEFGKPFLKAPDGPETHFNVSHSGDFTLIAITRSGTVGIDVEKKGGNHEIDGVADLSFTRAERLRLGALPLPEKSEEFMSIWTGKEAVAKAWGRGMSLPFITLEIPSRVSPPACGWPIAPLQPDLCPLFLKNLPAIPGYASAIAMANPFSPIYWKEL